VSEAFAGPPHVQVGACFLDAVDVRLLLSWQQTLVCPFNTK
jgi:hypothetical protein